MDNNLKKYLIRLMEISEGVSTLGDLHNSSDDTKAEFNNCQISRCYYNYTSIVSLSTKECTGLFQQFLNRRFVSYHALAT